MLVAVHPKLPSRNLSLTREFYVEQLGFTQVGGHYPDYLMLGKDAVELHFFLFAALDPKENYGQVYLRVKGIDRFYQS